MIPGVRLRKRILVVFGCFVFSFILLTARLAYVQVIRGDELRAEALDYRMWEVEVQARRGNIYDRNGYELAVSVTADSVYVVPAEIQDPDQTAKVLAEVLGEPYSEIYGRITRNVSFAWVERKVPDEVARRIREMALPGVYFVQESRRIYPGETLAAHVLGIAGIDNQGLEGIEYFYDEVLRGKSGRIKVEFDAHGRELPHAMQEYVPPVDGQHLVLTLDENIQHIAERELDRAIMAHQARAGYVLVMDPRTGEILALAARPTFDPNDFAEYPASVRRNPTVSDTMPPGSAFKPITAAAALEEGLLTPETGFYDPGYFRVPGHTIHNANRRGLGSTTFAEGFEKSANTIFAKVAANYLGTDLFYQYLDAFGLREKTGIDLPGEAAGIQPPKERARTLDLAVMGFGQTLTVTPMQMLTAISALANDGTMIRPRLAKALVNEDGNILREFSPEIVRQVVSPETAATVRQLMGRVVQNGTGTRAQVEGYSVGGKTGTSQKVIDGRIAPGRYIASFIGLAPVESPRVVIYVVIDEPQGIYYGGWVAAPVYARVARDVLTYLGVPPEEEEKPEREVLPAEPTLLPNVVNLPVEEALAVLRYSGLDPEVQGDGPRVTAQFPSPGVRLPTGSQVLLATDGELSGVETFSLVTVPDLIGLTEKEAADRLARVGLQMESQGEGVIARQDPAAGLRVPGQSFVRVVLEEPEGRENESENASDESP